MSDTNHSSIPVARGSDAKGEPTPALPAAPGEGRPSISRTDFIVIVASLVRYVLLITCGYTLFTMVLLALDNRELSYLNEFGLKAEAHIESVSKGQASLSFVEIGGTLIRGVIELPETQDSVTTNTVAVRYSLAEPYTFVLNRGLAESNARFLNDIRKLVAFAAGCLIVALALGEYMSRLLWRAHGQREREAYR